MNRRNLGSTKNFESAARACTGDIIAFADQDDVWLPHKLARLEAEFADARVGVAFSDAEVVDNLLRPLGYTLWRSSRFSPADQKILRERPFEILLRHNVVTGATAAFRASLRDRLFPIDPQWVHDAWIAFMSALVADLAPIPEPTMLYRQHDANQIGGVRQSTATLAKRKAEGWATQQRDTFRRDHAFWRAALQHARKIDADARGKAAVQRLAERVEHLAARAQLPHRRASRLPTIARELASGRYSRHSKGALSAVKDVLL